MATLTYSAAVFEVPDEDHARRLILTPEADQGTEERWAKETPYLGDLMAEQLSPTANSLILDYGCGIGRLADVLIRRFKCRVLGVDLSTSMRSLAPDFVSSQHFSVVSPHLLHSMIANGLKIDGAIAVWVLQHCYRPQMDLDVIRAGMRPGSRLLVVNESGRAVPTAEGRWARDGLDVRALLNERFVELASGKLDPSVVPAATSERTFWATYSSSSVSSEE
jgi:cyclopropane fatty-acyl-phospholipid synthase-like methyltransferase